MKLARFLNYPVGQHKVEAFEPPTPPLPRRTLTGAGNPDTSAISIPAGAAQEMPPAPAPSAPQPAMAAQPPLPSAPTVSSFITPQSVTSFAGGTAATTLIWQVSQILFPGAGATPWAGFFSAVAVGALIYWVSTSDQNLDHSRSEKIKGMIFAFLNCLVLFCAALGARASYGR